LARQIRAAACHRGGKKVRILSEVAQRRVGLPKSDHHKGAVALDLKLTLAHDLVEALEIDLGIDQRR
jgi:hypothetical protein